ncbi:LysR family transcriptional regulator substrate-binding protein [uncultured Megasphaera sp.]|uniref:LysR family transcriptional regulator substrate-binding protein n=1 Tax=uncultured Megasphaera sp. TaxID=165188 RepID=UPI0026282497|nr:LysR family transcriptional regulator substrate-binding protein [uncultured Megasphaera sp.]
MRQHIRRGSDAEQVRADGQVIEMVEAGFGIAIVPESWITSRYSASLKMHPLNPPCQRTIWLAWIHGRYMTQEARCFRDFLLGM